MSEYQEDTSLPEYSDSGSRILEFLIQDFFLQQDYFQGLQGIFSGIEEHVLQRLNQTAELMVQVGILDLGWAGPADAITLGPQFRLQGLYHMKVPMPAQRRIWVPVQLERRSVLPKDKSRYLNQCPFG